MASTGKTQYIKREDESFSWLSSTCFIDDLTAFIHDWCWAFAKTAGILAVFTGAK